MVSNFITSTHQNLLIFSVNCDINPIAYKGAFDFPINGALTCKKQNPNYVIYKDKQEYIDNLTSYIQTQEVPQDMVVYRGEGYDVLNSAGNITFHFNGETTTKPLGALLQDAESYPEEKRLHLVNQLLDMNLVATQERFMSTSAYESVTSTFNPCIIWELTVPAGSHALYAELANLFSVNNEECEFILQRDSQITITSIEYEDGKFGQTGGWRCKGTVKTP